MERIGRVNHVANNAVIARDSVSRSRVANSVCREGSTLAQGRNYEVNLLRVCRVHGGPQ